MPITVAVGANNCRRAKRGANNCSICYFPL